MKTKFVSFQQSDENFMNATIAPHRSPGPSAVILAGSFTDIEKASAGAAAALPPALRLSPVAADREGEMWVRLYVDRLFAFLRRHPALHGAVWGIGVATMLALAFVQLRARFDDPLQRLQLTHRTYEARLTGVAYVPRRITRGDGSEAAGAAAARIRADLDEALEADRSPENLRRAATAELATGRADRARTLLEEARRLKPNDVSILSDLAAAELADHHVSDAAEHSAMALELDPGHAEAAFTWAMAMTQFSNRPAAIEAWRRYLIIDPDSAWAAEARAHLEVLEQPRVTWAEERNALVAGADAVTVHRLVAKYPYHTRLRVLNVLLSQWAASGDSQILALMRAMATERASLDPYLLDCVEHAAAHRAAAVPGILKFQEGLSAYDAGDFDAAFSRFDDAEQIYDAAQSPLAIIAAIFAASMNAYAGRVDESLARVSEIETRLDSVGDRYPSMVGDTMWLRGLVQQRTGFPGLALENYRRAAAALHRSGETEQEIAAQQLIATALDYHGDPWDAEQVRIAALRASDAISADRDRMFGAYADTAYTALRSGRPRLARAFAYAQTAVANEQYEVTDRATVGSSSEERERRLAGARELRERWSADADIRRALALLEIGRVDGAEQSIASARGRAMSIVSNGYRDRVLADIDFTTGVVAQRRNQTDASIVAFSSAIDLWNRQHFRLHTASGYLARAEAYRRSGNRAAAERDYRAGIEDFEAQRNGLEPDLRVAHFERAERLFERLTGLLLEAGRDADALTIAERKRARVLLEQVAAGAAAVPLDAEQIRTALPKGRALLEITSLDDSVEAWLVYEGTITHARAAASRQEIESAVARHLAALDAGDQATLRANGRWLYDKLLGPLVSALPNDTNIVVVADGAVETLPFASLITPDGRYVVERFALPIAPSASVLLRRMPRHEYASLLSVAEPQPGDLPRLDAAAAEARSVAEQQPRSRYVAGAAIEPSEFLIEAGSSSCVHFAGHARTDVEHPSRSALLFESAFGPAEELTASRIAASRLRSAPLVVLAACSTGRGKLRRNEGIQSLAAAFLQAGARGVVATLWDVEDVRSAKLFRSFHLQLREGARPADALRGAQRVLLRSNDPRDRSPSIWASAVVEGTF